MDRHAGAGAYASCTQWGHLRTLTRNFPCISGCRTCCVRSSASSFMLVSRPIWFASTGSHRLFHPTRTESSSRNGQHETSLIDEEDQVDDLAASTGRAPEPLQDR